MPDNQLLIRMYRQGLGDCFLLQFCGPAEPVSVMIDCGALVSQHYDQELMRAVVTDLRARTDGKLDVLVATHQHWDHISGFMSAKDIFDTIEVENVWLGWTEDPKDRQAAKIRKALGKKKKALEMALERLPADKRGAALSSAVTALFGFEGGVGVRAGGVVDAWDYVMKKGKNIFCDPAKPPLELAGIPGVRFYVLGPPRDADMFRKLLSSKETYDEGRRGFGSFVAAFAQAGATGRCPSPFEKRFAIDLEQAKESAYFRDRYGFEEGDKGPQWRRIDHEWLDYTGELALQLDSYTNNTSLALAIELVESGKVLIFPGDAQVGNWLSWEELSWKVRERDGSEKTVTIDDLFTRTVFYKVGHHGSHNATLRAKGLEKMVDPELVAFIPVHRATADDQEWKFPFPPLWERLKQKAQGRVVLSDEESLEEGCSEAKKVLPKSEWKRFCESTEITDLYVEYRLPF